MFNTLTNAKVWAVSPVYPHEEVCGYKFSYHTSRFFNVGSPAYATREEAENARAQLIASGAEARPFNTY